MFGAASWDRCSGDLTWTPVVYGVLSLTAVRMLPVAVALAGTRARLPTVTFLGWFGPRGLASIVFTVIVLEDSALPHVHAITVVVVFTVVLSVVRPRTDLEGADRSLRRLVRAAPRGRETDDGSGAGGAAALATLGEEMTGTCGYCGVDQWAMNGS